MQIFCIKNNKIQYIFNKNICMSSIKNADRCSLNSVGQLQMNILNKFQLFLLGLTWSLLMLMWKLHSLMG
jgi:hypothetical protein